MSVAWEALYIRSLLLSDAYILCESLWMLPEREDEERNTL